MNKAKKRISIAVTVALTCLLASFPVLAADKTTTAEIEFTTGTLALHAAPSFAFGAQQIDAEDKDYPSTTDATQILDVRDARGTGEGWSIQVELLDFSNGATSTLPGAKLKITPEANFTQASPGVTPGTGTEVTLVSGDGQKQTVATAQTSQGLGVSTNTPTSVLTIFSGTARVGSHNAKLEWTINATP